MSFLKFGEKNGPKRKRGRNPLFLVTTLLADLLHNVMYPFHSGKAHQNCQLHTVRLKNLMILNYFDITGDFKGLLASGRKILFHQSCDREKILKKLCVIKFCIFVRTSQRNLILSGKVMN